MAKQHISLGAAPANEPCAQVGVDGYREIARHECKRHIEVLRAFYIAQRGAIPDGLTFKLKSNQHDFGDYLDVIVEFDETDCDALEAALWLDNNRPCEWPDHLVDR